jgi:hypothetical protein
VIDNLQFLLSGYGIGNKKFDLQDLVVGKLRAIASKYKIHVSLVVHPRKTEEKVDLDVSSFYGSGKAAQEVKYIWGERERGGLWFLWVLGDKSIFFKFKLFYFEILFIDFRLF